METTRLTVTTEEAGQRADSLLARRLEGLTRSAAARLLEEGRVTDRGRPVAKNLRVQPGQVLEVTLLDEGKSCRVIVPDNQLSLAIGKEGQNARLAAKLTGYKIDIKPESEA